MERQFLETELEVLQRGEKTPVLDLWKVDRRCYQRHPFFGIIDTVLIDPEARELQIGLRFKELHWVDDQREQQATRFLNSLVSFVHIATTDNAVTV